MALTGLHVVCSFAGGNSKAGRGGIPLLGQAIWSETLPTAGTTTASVPDGEPPNTHVISLRSSADVWVAIGNAPNATTGPRRYLAAGTDLDVFANVGNKVAWVAA